MKASTQIAISGGGDCWKVAQPSDPPDSVKVRAVRLEIAGDEREGYHLIQSPEGCFTADTWHETVKDAQEAAERIFDVNKSAWRP